MTLHHVMSYVGVLGSAGSGRAFRWVSGSVGLPHAWEAFTHPQTI